MLGAKSVEEVVGILEEHKKGFKVFRAHGENARAVVAPIVTPTKLFIDAVGEIAAASSIVPGSKAIFAAFGVLLGAAEKVSKRLDALEGLLSRLGGVLSRLRNHLRSHSKLSVELENIFVSALVQLLNVLAICTQYVRKRTSWRSAILKRMRDYGRALLGDKNVKEALEKLDDLTREEILANTAQMLDMAQGIAAQVDVVGGGVVEIKDNVKAVSNDVADLRVIAVESHNLRLDKDIRDWLAPPDPGRNHEERRTSHLDGTCTWFFDSKFEEWKDSKNGVYWIYGNPMDRYPAHQLRLHDADAHTRDLVTYVSHGLAKDDYSSWPLNIKELAQKELVSNASGMFLWVNLQLDMLRSCPPGDVQKALTELPKTIY
ncbi:uncharacterized protein PHACADRAFT_201834 [Phanerochaete carnosa HHB-10118-sp]|uniref:Fungal STAND N-terminal Goodbye domain-containing protein n=1 Tax=Phanerochaete carnosa (strain HHB-10118-sp) TaxID=650164 RepID=K5WGE9_PHACS|nr:uncharacterized protein PHACADRAFT_201834 [Phanerochaete carnosa HHB-10118-sp]EKM49272.1 hypothetical protein PHACADRAFT_201834 [Phanerochaete carnosa HHB-10118-sp]